MDTRLDAVEPGAVARILRPRLLELVTLWGVGLLAALDIVFAVAFGRPPAAVVDTLLLLAASLAGGLRFSAWWALAGAVVAPIATVLLGQNSIDTWPVAGFVVFLAAIRGVPAPIAGAAASAANCLAFFIQTGQLHGGMLATIIAAILAPIIFASAGGTVREQRRHSADTARYLKQAVAAQESEIRERIALERIRIARDLHDALGQEVTLVSLSLGAAQLNLPSGAEAATEHLSAARKGLQAMLQEIQRIVSVLRTDPGNDLEPLSSYEQLDSLIESFLAVGLDVKSSVDPSPAELDLGVGAAVYHIAQEALTNANRHGAGPVTLTVTGSPSQVLVEVSNPIDPKLESDGGGTSGFGLVGMRERAASVGGTLATSVRDGVFMVRAALPVGSGEAFA
ncbi:MAG: histidine kinase [Propionibacteriaceae bacterium]|jgi:signal transduction histidine kinase|nr:histidine kinase [Propionibacteriaceae bacterium]